MTMVLFWLYADVVVVVQFVGKLPHDTITFPLHSFRYLHSIFSYPIQMLHEIVERIPPHDWVRAKCCWRSKNGSLRNICPSRPFVQQFGLLLPDWDCTRILPYDWLKSTIGKSKKGITTVQTVS